MGLNDRGLFLCSNGLLLEHPYYNSKKGRAEWKSMDPSTRPKELFERDDDGKVMVRVGIPLPDKYQNLLDWEERHADQPRLVE
mmetsp:Transcript_30937/g.47428  ORF Transcript_30937/g.47428 Transcript_30937/m.47428 type:complete len:83 (+) Transcript_30937:75-323(+)